MDNKSEIIRKLTPHELIILKKELDVNNNLWDDHSGKLAGRTALRDGKTIYIQEYNDSLELISSNLDNFPETHALLQNITENKKLGKIYWHRLMPGNNIYPHNDSELEFVRTGQIITRYQIYLDIDPSFTLCIDDEVYRDKSILENALVDFKLKNRHFYFNTSNKVFYILVFDTVI